MYTDLMLDLETLGVNPGGPSMLYMYLFASTTLDEALAYIKQQMEKL